MASRYSPPQAVDDVAQEAILRAWRARDTCRDPLEPWAWLAQIVRNEAFRHATRRDSDPMTAPVSVETLDTLELRLDVEVALRTLGELDRTLVRLYYQQDLSVADLAKAVGLSPGAVKVRLHRARAALRPVLGER